MSNQPAQTAPLVRRRWHIRGQVQGVGFRPFVWRIAEETGVTGFIRNDAAGVVIEAQGPVSQLDHFIHALQAQLPPLARIEQITAEEMPPMADETRFVIQASAAGDEPQAVVTVDSAVCPDCLRELFDPSDRRFGYGLINCTNCGPRFSIIRQVPYDRANTTMADFALCRACAAEYQDPACRRFHAQPISCPQCGPQVELQPLSLPEGEVGELCEPGEGEKQTPKRRNAETSKWFCLSNLPPPPSLAKGGELVVPLSLAKGEGLFHAAAQMLWDGKILAIKGLGGFHLAVRADDEAAVGRLRRLKHRDAKPFALMCGSLEAVRRLVQLDERAGELLTSKEAPIVLALRRTGILPVSQSSTSVSPVPDSPKGNRPDACSTSSKDRQDACPTVAPGSHRLGVMLPYTPIHHLLFAALHKLTGETACPPLVMTSGNLSDEPLVISNQDAWQRLGGLCDAVLWHDRPIQRALDDSVYLAVPDDDPLPIRRSRGFVPTEIPLFCGAASPGGPGPAGEPVLHASGLCVGGELKNTVAVVRSGSAILSQHLGDLTHALAFENFQQAIQDLITLFGVDVRWIAHDLHPQYLSTVHARELAKRLQVPLIGVQHHHAHVASVMAEHGEVGPVLAVVCDGTGYGDDGTIWGGELLQADLGAYRRLARLRPLPLAGGDAAAKDTRRCALALLQQAFGDSFQRHSAAERIVPAETERSILCAMLRKNVNCTPSSGTGRYFDGVAALLGLCSYNRYEAEAGLSLEASAEQALPTQAGLRVDEPLFVRREDDVHKGLWQLDLSLLIRWLMEAKEQGRSVSELSAIFHDQLAWAWEDAVATAAAETGICKVALSGGVFCNLRFGLNLQRRLEKRGLSVLRHRKVPPNDGGLALGQAAVAMQKRV